MQQVTTPSLFYRVLSIQRHRVASKKDKIDNTVSIDSVMLSTPPREVLDYPHERTQMTPSQHEIRQQ